MEIDLDKKTITRQATPEEVAQEKLARFLVDGLGLLPPSPDGERRSGGHRWNRTHTRDREIFRDVAKQAMVFVRSELSRAYDR